jgi:hypothetical protein
LGIYINRIAAGFCVVLLGLAGCASHGPRTVPVKSGEMFAGNYVNIRAPLSEGWELIQSSPAGMAFAKGDRSAGESFVAQVGMFDLAPTETPEEFQRLITTSAEKDTDPACFDVQQASVNYSTERSYPCVRYDAVAKDKAPQGLKGPLVLELRAIYCRHPVRSETGFAAIYSQRGMSAYPNLQVEAEAFIQGVQVPSK